MPILYRAHASATGGREGVAESHDGRVKVSLSVPKELGGDGGPGTNPEQLFAAGYAACFLGALKYVAREAKIAIPDTARVEAEVGIGPREDGGGFGLEVAIRVSVPGMERAVLEDLIRKAEIVCPYAHATRGNIRSQFTAL
jgi:osmotically inducible protein OsmC